jgi:hypothetical protein
VSSDAERQTGNYVRNRTAKGDKYNIVVIVPVPFSAAPNRALGEARGDAYNIVVIVPIPFSILAAEVMPAEEPRRAIAQQYIAA